MMPGDEVFVPMNSLDLSISDYAILACTNGYGRFTGTCWGGPLPRVEVELRDGGFIRVAKESVRVLSGTPLPWSV
jgi:hypothetical protein